MDETVKVTSITPGLVQDDIIQVFKDLFNKLRINLPLFQGNSNDEIVKLMPSLAGNDVANAVVFAISVKEHVEIHEIVIKPVGEFL